MYRDEAVALQKPATAHRVLTSGEHYTMHKFDLIPLKQTEFVLKQSTTWSTHIRNTKYRLNSSSLKQLTKLRQASAENHPEITWATEQSL